MALRRDNEQLTQQLLASQHSGELLRIERRRWQRGECSATARQAAPAPFPAPAPAAPPAVQAGAAAAAVGFKRARGEDDDAACVEGAVAPPPTKRVAAVWLRACRDMYARVASSFV